MSDKPIHTITGYPWTWRGVLNILVLQWFFVRLMASIDTESRRVEKVVLWWNNYWYVRRPMRFDGRWTWRSWIIRPTLWHA